MTVAIRAGGTLKRVAPVANFGLLPASNNVAGDSRICLDSLAEYVWNGSLWLPAAVLDLEYGNQEYDDFEADALGSSLNWSNSVTGTSAVVTVDTTALSTNHFGVRSLATGTTATGRAGFYISVANRLIGGSRLYMEADVRFPALSDATNRYSFRFGIGNFWNTSTTSPINGVCFAYDDVTSLNFRGVNQNGAAVSTLITGTPVAANTWYRLGILVEDAPVAQATFFVNGVSAGAPVSTNLPTGAGMGFGFRILKSLGTTSRSVLVDYFCQRTRLTSSR